MAKKKNRGGRRKKSDNDDTRKDLLDAARHEFAESGLAGARIDRIAKRASVNKQLVYHYFGSKDALYAAVLEDAYRSIREKEQELDLRELPAAEAMRTLIEFSFDYLEQNREFVALVADENAHLGQHLNNSSTVERLNRPIIEMIRDTLVRGVSERIFRAGLDPFQVYLSIAALSFFYFSNAHTLSRIFDKDLLDKAMIKERRQHIVEFAMAALLEVKPAPNSAA